MERCDGQIGAGAAPDWEPAIMNAKAMVRNLASIGAHASVEAGRGKSCKKFAGSGFFNTLSHNLKLIATSSPRLPIC
jgi:hypothetical protein